jgi:hypothetical protein
MHTVVETSAYLREASKLLSDTEREGVVSTIAKDPEIEDVIAGTGGFRKIRIALREEEKAAVPASFITSATKPCPCFLCGFTRRTTRRISAPPRKTS